MKQIKEAKKYLVGTKHQHEKNQKQKNMRENVMISNKGPLKIKSSHKLIIKRVSILFFFICQKENLNFQSKRKK